MVVYVPGMHDSSPTGSAPDGLPTCCSCKQPGLPNIEIGIVHVKRPKVEKDPGDDAFTVEQPSYAWGDQRRTWVVGRQA